MVYCFSCGARLDPSLEPVGSLRCHECRDGAEPVRLEWVSPEQLARPVLTLIKTFPLPPEPPPYAAA
jgi:hypothetical protein